MLFQDSRTTSGGALLADARAQTTKDDVGNAAQVYVCPKGFSGTYNVVVRRVWGKVVVNTVKVNVYTHFLTDKQICVSKCLPLENDEIHVRFQLTGGRRTESLREQQVADTAVTHLAIQQQVLAQQIAAAIDPTTLAAAYALRGSVGANGGSEAAVPFPWMLQGAVGYQPVITVLTEGTRMGAAAVISADRRYVRVSAIPSFSAIAKVTTYNTSSGAQSTTAGGTGSGGTGGSGFSGLGGGSSGTSGGLGGNSF